MPFAHRWPKPGPAHTQGWSARRFLATERRDIDGHPGRRRFAAVLPGMKTADRSQILHSAGSGGRNVCTLLRQLRGRKPRKLAIRCSSPYSHAWTVSCEMRMEALFCRSVTNLADADSAFSITKRAIAGITERQNRFNCDFAPIMARKQAPHRLSHTRKTGSWPGRKHSLSESSEVPD